MTSISDRSQTPKHSQVMSLAKLTSLSTQTLTLLLERQRIQTLPTTAPGSTNSLHIRQITKNLHSLRNGILEFQEKEGSSETVGLLKNQYERMRAMLGDQADAAGIEPLQEPEQDAPEMPVPQQPYSSHAASGSFTPYTDDPDVDGQDSNEMLMQAHREIMDEQDDRLDHLSHSISRQHHISLQINDELEVHTGLLDGLDQDLDGTHTRLSGARRRLDRVAKGAKENSSTVTIALLIFILLLLIIVFKT